MKGDAVSFRATGRWIDWFIPCDADGYPMPLFIARSRGPRIPDGNRYFRLMGRISDGGQPPGKDDPDATFHIGCCAEQVAQRSGVIFVFVNDRDGYYWNNWGYVSLTITVP
ncbi:MAG: hypothetical protein WBW32_18270 [Luteibacter sp.]